MRRPSWQRAVVALSLGLLALTAVAISPRPVRSQDEPVHGSRTAFMRQKLVFAQNLLEALTVEDYPKMERSARALKRLSLASEWEVPTIPNVEQYIPLTTQFQKITDDIARAGKDKNLDAATTAYTELAKNCVACHKFVRMVPK